MVCILSAVHFVKCVTTPSEVYGLSPRRIHFHTLDVFTDRAFGGNPLAVIPDASGLTSAEMQQIAAEFNLSETAFVGPPSNGGTHRVRIFTPAAELPFAGHPTVGTALLLAHLGDYKLVDGVVSLIFEEGVGAVPVAVHLDALPLPFAELTASQAAEVRDTAVTTTDLAAMLSLDPADVVTRTVSPVTASCGVPFLFVPLRDTNALGRARLVESIWSERLAGHWAPHVFLYVLSRGSPSEPIRARMFAPALGITEDPATGGAVSALAGYLSSFDKDRREREWTILQGVEMGRPSTLTARVVHSPGGSTSIHVGGTAVRIAEGVLWVP